MTSGSVFFLNIFKGNMSTDFIVTAKNIVDRFSHRNFEQDAGKFSVDFRPWNEDNEDITSVVWTSEYGPVSISSPILSAGVASAILTFSNAGVSVVSLKASGPTMTKKIIIKTRTESLTNLTDDYGLNDG